MSEQNPEPTAEPTETDAEQDPSTADAVESPSSDADPGGMSADDDHVQDPDYTEAPTGDDPEPHPDDEGEDEAQ